MTITNARFFAPVRNHLAAKRTNRERIKLHFLLRHDLGVSLRSSFEHRVVTEFAAYLPAVFPCEVVRSICEGVTFLPKKKREKIINFKIAALTLRIIIIIVKFQIY